VLEGKILEYVEDSFVVGILFSMLPQLFLYLELKFQLTHPLKCAIVFNRVSQHSIRIQRLGAT